MNMKLILEFINKSCTSGLRSKAKMDYIKKKDTQDSRRIDGWGLREIILENEDFLRNGGEVAVIKENGTWIINASV